MSCWVRKYQKTNLLAPKVSSNSDNMNSLSFFSYFWFLLIFWENGKMIIASKLFLVVLLVLVVLHSSIPVLSSVIIIYSRFSKPQNRVKSCFTCQFFTPDTAEVTNEVNTHTSRVKRAFLQNLSLDSKTIIYFILYYYYFQVMLV